MPSSGRHILDIKKKPSSRTKARAEMKDLFASTKPRQKPTRLRTQRQKKRIILGCVCALAVLALVGGLGAVSHLEQLSINDISVTGAQALPTEALVASAAATMHSDSFQLFSRENMFLYPRAAIEKTLAADFPRIKDVSLSRPSLVAQAVVVTVEERVPYAKWCTADGVCYLLDSAGFIFAEAAEEIPTLAYTFHGGLAPNRSPVGQWFLRGRLATTVSLIGKLWQAGYETQALSVDSEKDFSVQLARGPKLFLSFDMDADTSVRNLQTALGADGLSARFGELEYVDLRFGNRVYYR